MCYSLTKPICLVALMLAAASAAVADVYPSKPIRLIVPGTAGGVLDVHARKIGEKLGRSMGQAIVVDNRPGAGGNIAADLAATAKPDGYTLFFSGSGTLTINPSLYPTLPFDPVKDFVPITRGPAGYPILLANPQLPVKSVPELIALAKAKPGQLMYASPGVGSPHHLAGALLGARAGVELVHVAYKGSPQAMTDLMAGQIQVGFEWATIAQPLVQAGKLRALAIAGPARKPLLPDVPTLAEAGLPGFEILGWAGFFAPNGTPPEILEKLHRELIKAMAEQDYIDYVHTLGSEVMTNTPEEFAAFLDAERAKWAPIVKASGARLE